MLSPGELQDRAKELHLHLKVVEKKFNNTRAELKLLKHEINNTKGALLEIENILIRIK
jgi:hypothetical protein